MSGGGAGRRGVWGGQWMGGNRAGRKKQDTRRKRGDLKGPPEGRAPIV